MNPFKRKTYTGTVETYTGADGKSHWRLVSNNNVDILASGQALEGGAWGAERSAKRARAAFERPRWIRYAKDPRA